MQYFCLFHFSCTAKFPVKSFFSVRWTHPFHESSRFLAKKSVVFSFTMFIHDRCCATLLFCWAFTQRGMVYTLVGTIAAARATKKTQKEVQQQHVIVNSKRFQVEPFQSALYVFTVYSQDTGFHTMKMMTTDEMNEISRIRTWWIPVAWNSRNSDIEIWTASQSFYCFCSVVLSQLVYRCMARVVSTIEL